MNKKWFFTWLATMLGLLAASVWYIYTPGSAPEGQPKLVTLNAKNIHQFQSEFNEHVDKIRIVALFSPT